MRPLGDIVMGACANPVKLLNCHPEPGEQRKIGADLRTRMREARRFFVDEDVTRAATILGVQHPDILMQMLRRARLPFNRVWVEWDNHAQAEEAGATVADDAPERIGALIERLSDDQPIYRMTCIGNGTRHDSATISPISIIYHLHDPIGVGPLSIGQKLVQEVSDLPEDYLKASLIGSAYTRLPGMDDDEVAHRRVLCNNLSAHASYVPTPFFSPIMPQASAMSPRDRIMITDLVRSNVVEMAGSWRFIVSLFALINSRDYVESDRELRANDGSKSRLVSGKIVPYLDHWLVKLKLPRKVVQARVIQDFAEAIPRRRHEVIGHWKHSRKRWPGLPDCQHAFVEETPSREVCAIPGCQHRRWWVNEFQRGDATIGMIIKDRLVTKE